MLPHDAVDPLPDSAGAYRILKPRQIGRWTYPCEWSFGQLKEAALVTLRINLAALEAGMLLKDATPQNVQFVDGKAVWIDTLSFETLAAGAPWTAFRQFCTQLLYPLLLAHYLPAFSPGLLAAQPDGFSAEWTASVLPRRARWNLSNRLYVYLPASLERKAGQQTEQAARQVSPASIRRNLDHLYRRIEALKPANPATDWERYYRETILSDRYLQAKEAQIGAWLEEARPDSVLDLGCNTGIFSLLAAKSGCPVTAVDSDTACIDRLFLQVRAQNIPGLVALVADLTHPLAGGGWGGREWKPLLERLAGHHTVFALALIHHLALAKNVPLPFIAALLHQLCTQAAVVEWIPKSDPKAQELLRYRADVFDGYDQAAFEASLAAHFVTVRTEPVAGSERILYFLQKR